MKTKLFNICIKRKVRETSWFFPRHGIISQNEAFDMMQILAKEGRYRDDIIFKAFSHIGVK